MLSAATVRRLAVALGAFLLALTLSGPAWGQTLGGAGSVVGATTQSLAPVTKVVTGTASKAVEPVAKRAAKATRPAEAQASAPAKTTRPAKAQASTPAKTSKTSAPATKAVTRPTRPVASRRAASRVDTVASRATRSVEPLAAAATRSVTDTLRTATAVLPSETQALLGPLVETIDGQAEELTGSLLASARWCRPRAPRSRPSRFGTGAGVAATRRRRSLCRPSPGRPRERARPAACRRCPIAALRSRPGRTRLHRRRPLSPRERAWPASQPRPARRLHHPSRTHQPHRHPRSAPRPVSRQLSPSSPGWLPWLSRRSWDGSCLGRTRSGRSLSSYRLNAPASALRAYRRSDPGPARVANGNVNEGSKQP